jgi:cyclopropane-fatty-acyl-phospholipid synthase
VNTIASRKKVDPPRAGHIARMRDRALLGAVKPVFRQAGLTPVSIRMPSGVDVCLGLDGAPAAQLTMNSLLPIWRSFRRGGLGFAESFMEGEIETDDLARLIGYFIDNYEALVAAGKGQFRVRAPDAAWHSARENTREGSRRNISAHYDLGNAFYRLWLDEGMTYSSALQKRPDDTLEDAQAKKYELTLDALELKPGHRLAEIGCGWGGMAECSARAGAEVTAITLSQEQFAYAHNRMKEAGLDRQTDIRLQDYRDLSGAFDRLVSIEMIEAVGEAHWPAYFATIARNLKSGGHAVIQAITIGERDFELYRSRPDFIQRYIFPGGMLPTVPLIQLHAERAGLSFERMKEFGQSYAWTLRQWRRRFFAAWPQIEALGFDTRFRRMWEYYLVYCEVGFERGVVDVGTYRLHKRA